MTDNTDSGLLERRRKEKVRSSSSSLLGQMGGGSGSEEEGERQRLLGGRIHRFKLNGKVGIGTVVNSAFLWEICGAEFDVL